MGVGAEASALAAHGIAAFEHRVTLNNVKFAGFGCANLGRWRPKP
jgi:hypothetical protein